MTKADTNALDLRSHGIRFGTSQVDLLAADDELLSQVSSLIGGSVDTIILDITSFPKRFFCLFVKVIINTPVIRNLVVTYSLPGTGGHTKGHLAEDPLPLDFLPGFAGPVSLPEPGLIISVGFESLGVRAVLDEYRSKRNRMKVIMSFPPDGEAIRRQWSTLMAMCSGDASAVFREDITSVSAWDAEHVFMNLCRWWEENPHLVLAPFGPKPHTLAMALFAISRDLGMFYTQPKSYNPEYCSGIGEAWAYVVKWNGIRCIDCVA